MQVNLNNPQSIADWWAICPDRHGPMLRFWLTQKSWGQFHEAIAASRELVKRQRQSAAAGA